MFLKLSGHVIDNYGDFVNVLQVQAAQLIGNELKVFLVGSTKPFSVVHVGGKGARASYKKLLKNIRIRDSDVLEFADVSGVSFVRPGEIVSLATTTVPGVLGDREKTPCVWPALVLNLKGDKSLAVEGRSFSKFDERAIAFISKLSME